MLSKPELNKLLHWVASTPTLFNLSPPVCENSPFSQDIPSRMNVYTGNQRLGFVYQYACRCLFQTSSKYKLLGEEIQLQQDGRTLGSIDFILENRESQTIEHWEVAIKFYLLHNTFWYGPNAKDRLDLKLDRMLSHQLKMSSSQAFQLQCPKWKDSSEHLLMQGRLYINPFHDEDIPQNCLDHPINPSRIKGYWCYDHQKHLITDKLYVLEKKDWATGRRDESLLFTGEINKFVHCQSEKGQYWFIVHNQWPNN
ncbi:DUF1853 family protein [Vibrio sp. S9_S30]|uniref:DUF1853 family protein n=1 Tax=Vibrio sp. S9_S30 TaxID=2720226 RepID=UPI001681A12B|nr:DUF1853 family protein [Vibrio sp. S9_S30]MBD1559120.1 DUF1853 family protein [Vibrio sp. S9_S30]